VRSAWVHWRARLGGKKPKDSRSKSYEHKPDNAADSQTSYKEGNGGGAFGDTVGKLVL
jgi:hypothetical protein